MIIVNLMGGLGNQMFQYAFGKRLSMYLNKKLVLDNSFLLENRTNPEVTPRDFELSIFSITEEPITYDHGFGLGQSFPYRMNKLLDPLMKKFKDELIVSDNDPLEEILMTKASKVILNGWFQKECYFVKEEETIRRAFVFKNILSEENLEIKRKMSNSNSVSVHVRRGDYVTNPYASAHHGVCGLDYYTKAIQKLTNLFPDLHFFIFSDDIQWCKENLNIPGDPDFISHNTGTNSYIDMQLMSICKHHIIANSSFSWWGAWLNSSTEKVVIAPKNWFTDKTINVKDLYPKNWLTL